jgi:XTP/dITP diphosphohydrolase
VYSARYAGEPKDDNKNINKVLLNLHNQTNRKANFKTVICLNLNDKQYLFTGIVNGSIINEKKGDNGFGYDSIFVPDGYDKTFAQMTFEEKNQISHRAKAVMQMIDFLKNNEY